MVIAFRSSIRASIERSLSVLAAIMKGHRQRLCIAYFNHRPHPIHDPHFQDLWGLSSQMKALQQLQINCRQEMVFKPRGFRI